MEPSLPSCLEEPSNIFVHRTMKDYMDKDDNYRILSSKIDKNHVYNANFALMAMCLRLLKTDKMYSPLSSIVTTSPLTGMNIAKVDFQQA